MEFLLGRALDNALLNLNLKKEYETSVNQLGFSMEDVLDSERDAGLGNGGLGRLAACYSEFPLTCFTFTCASLQEGGLSVEIDLVCDIVQWTLSHLWTFPLGDMVLDISMVVCQTPRKLTICEISAKLSGLTVFMQGIDAQGNQTEIPDPWLTGSNPWEVG